MGDGGASPLVSVALSALVPLLFFFLRPALEASAWRTARKPEPVPRPSQHMCFDLSPHTCSENHEPSAIKSGDSRRLLTPLYDLLRSPSLGFFFFFSPKGIREISDFNGDISRWLSARAGKITRHSLLM